MHRKIALSIFLLWSVSSLTPSLAKTPETIWVMHEFFGGTLCTSSGDEREFIPPGFAEAKKLFKKSSVAIYREYFRDIEECQVCFKCARYRRQIWFEISLDQIKLVEKFGFTPAINSPTQEEYTEFENAKRFIPKTPMPP